MDHASRIEIATMIASRLLAQQGTTLVYVGVFGSAHTATDTDASDIDLLAVTSGNLRFSDSGLPWLGLQIEHVVVGVGLYSLFEIDGMVGTPNFRWPFTVGKFVNNREVYALHDLRERCRNLIQATEQHRFMAAARVEYLEALSGIHRLRNRGAKLVDIRNVRSNALKFLSRLEACVALVNRSFLNDHTSFKNVAIISALPNAPRDYAALASTVWRSNSAVEIVHAAEELWGHALNFADRNGLQAQVYSLSDGLDTLTTLAT
jgi:hypothetical protein